MRVAFVSSQAQFTSGQDFASGPANYLLRVSLALQERGHEAVLFSLGTHDEEKHVQGLRVVTVGEKAPSKLARLANLTPHVHSYYSKVLNRRLRSYHRERPIDIIQYTNYRATALFRPAGIPAVMRISSYRPLWDEAHQTGGRTRSRRRARALEFQAFFRVDRIYGPSQVLSEAVARDTGRGVSVIKPPFFFEIEETDPSVLRKRAGEQPFILFVGSLTKRKGVHLLAEAVPRLMKRNPELLFILAGRDKPYQNGTMLEYLLSKTGAFADRVIYLGEVAHQQLYPFLSAARSVVLPSLMDNLPNSCLEAMAGGGIVVGTHGASFEELIEDGANGFLARNGDVDSIVQSVQRALDLTDAERDRIGGAARDRIEKLSPEIQLPQLISFFQDTIEEHRHGRSE